MHFASYFIYISGIKCFIWKRFPEAVPIGNIIFDKRESLTYYDNYRYINI